MKGGGFGHWSGNSNSYAGYDIDCDNFEFQTATEDDYYNWNNPRNGRNRNGYSIRGYCDNCC